jgi:preprotein translocase subunit SecA
LTYQRLFRRYIRLAGMTGTAHEVVREIRSVYELDVVRIPLHKPSRRTYSPVRVCATRAEKWREVADAVERLCVAGGRPVLIGTGSVRSSEEISAVLRERGIEHSLLNAKQDKSEAGVIALAGQPSRVTVATYMAGRGTDIRLGEPALRLAHEGYLARNPDPPSPRPADEPIQSHLGLPRSPVGLQHMWKRPFARLNDRVVVGDEAAHQPFDLAP